MKSSFRIILLLFFFLMLISSGSGLQDEPYVLAYGVITHNGEKVSGVSIKVFLEEELIHSEVTGRNVGYGFSLAYNRKYRIEIAKEGYLREAVLINTQVPDDVLRYGDNIPWEPDLVVYRLLPGLENESFDRPLARYIFSEELWGFYRDPVYVAENEAYFEGIKDNRRDLENKAFMAEKSQADSLVSRQKYEEAIMAYSRALQYTDQKKEIDGAIRNSRKLLRQQTNTEEAYNKAIRQADELMHEGKYDQANNYYQTALIYLPDENYPLDQLYTIDSIRTYSWLVKENQYERLMARGDSLIKQEDYTKASLSFTEAAGLFPEKKEPEKMLVLVKDLEEKRQEKEKMLARVDEKSDSRTQSDGNHEYEASSRDAESQENEVAINSRFEKPDPDSGSIREEVKAASVNETGKLQFEDRVNSDTGSAIKSPGKALPEQDMEERLELLQSDLETSQSSGDKIKTSGLLSEMGRLYQSDLRHREALESFNQSLAIRQDIGDKRGEMEVLNDIASVMYDSGSYQEAIKNFETSLDLSVELDDKQKSSEILSNIATVYENTFRYDEALEQLEKSQALKEETGDQEGISNIHKSKGSIYYEKNNFDKAAEELETSVVIEKKLNNKEEVAASLNSLGAAYYKMNQYEEAERNYEEALKYSEETNNLRDKALTLNNLGNINFNEKRYHEAIQYYEQSLALKREMNFDAGIATSLFNIGNAYHKLTEYNKALEYFTASMDIAEKANYYEVIWLNYEAFARTYAALGNYKKAFENYRSYTHSKFETPEDDMQLVEMREQYESSKLAVKNLRRELQKQSRIARYEAEKNRRELQIVELEVENKRQQLKRQRIVIVAFIMISILILIFSLLITKQYRLTRKAYRIVAEQKRNITEGINYAARIQNAVSPPDKFLQGELPGHFILNKPCEVVGGDFYWVARHQDKLAVAVSDCTGHGVPGGFMSMLGIALLNEIISTEDELETRDILNQLRTRVVESLHQEASGSEALDGMDITLILMDTKNREVQFSGAYHSLYLIRDGKFEKIKGDRVPIGFQHRQKPFTSQTFQLSEGDMIYLSTDGYPDQIGKKTMNRFMFGPFRDKLLAVNTLPLEEQKAELERTIETWRGDLPQTDDILVMGIRL